MKGTLGEISGNDIVNSPVGEQNDSQEIASSAEKRHSKRYFLSIGRKVYATMAGRLNGKKIHNEAINPAPAEESEDEAINSASVGEPEEVAIEDEETEELRREMLEGGYSGYWKEKLMSRGIQEAIERDLNSRLLKVNDLEIESLAENPEVNKRFAIFEGTEIPVYDLKGLPFRTLSTTIDYRRASEELNNGSTEGVYSMGINTFRRVMENPAVWMEPRDEVEKDPGFGMRNANARGDTISVSYRNSEWNIDSYYRGNLIYGFEEVDADSIICIKNGDGGTNHMAGKFETDVTNINAINELEGANGRGGYNEILLRRYHEDGMPKRPDYIIVENGRIAEVALRHAKYFGVPIINIERSVYNEGNKAKVKEIIASISEDDDYLKILRKIEELRSMSQCKNDFGFPLVGIGRNRDIPQFHSSEKKTEEILKMEQLKRLDFIKDALEGETQEIQSSSEMGVYRGQAFPQFKRFSVDIYENGFIRLPDRNISFVTWGPGMCKYISVEFQLKDGSYRKTDIYDGERIYQADEALARSNITEDDIKNANSSFYDALEPVVLRYFEAYRKNKALWEPSQA